MTLPLCLTCQLEGTDSFGISSGHLRAVQAVCCMHMSFYRYNQIPEVDDTYRLTTGPVSSVRTCAVLSRGMLTTSMDFHAGGSLLTPTFVYIIHDTLISCIGPCIQPNDCLRHTLLTFFKLIIICVIPASDCLNASFPFQMNLRWNSFTSRS